MIGASFGDGYYIETLEGCYASFLEFFTEQSWGWDMEKRLPVPIILSFYAYIMIELVWFPNGGAAVVIGTGIYVFLMVGFLCLKC